MAERNDQREVPPDAVLAHAWNLYNRGFSPREISDRLNLSIRDVQHTIDRGIMEQRRKSAKVRPETEEFAAHVQEMIRPTPGHGAKKAER